MIKRTGECPAYINYIINNVLIPRREKPTDSFAKAIKYERQWIDIPRYQRGIVWDEEMLRELLDSNSEFLGHATFSSFPLPEKREGLEFIPDDVSEFSVLVDGLQRFSVGTALLSILHPLVLSPEPSRPDVAPAFEVIKGRSERSAAIFLSNDKELRQHRRQVVAESYARFRNRMAQFVAEQFDENATDFAEKVERLFLGRQIAPDIFHGFTTPASVARTFIGLNTTRVELDIFDELRSVVVEKGETAGWSADVVEDVENRFSETFYEKGQPKTELRPFVAIVLNALSRKTETGRVFPSWASAFDQSEVLCFLDYIARVSTCDINPYFNEICEVGDIPRAGVLVFFYRQYLETGKLPKFLEGKNDDDPDLCLFLRANYRALFAGKIGRTRDAIATLLVDQNLAAVANTLSESFLGRALSSVVDEKWLEEALRESDRNRARRFFNACLLPERSKFPNVFFSPLTFGMKTVHHQIDHLIPETEIKRHSSGGREAQLITNFAPLPQPVNRGLGNATCAQKLAKNGHYDTHAQTGNSHPFCQWLITHQGGYGSRLNSQAELLRSSNPSRPSVGDQRIAWLVARLLDRL